MNDVTLVIQGPMGQKISSGLAKGIKNLKSYLKFGKIVISAWSNNKLKPSKKFLFNHNITLVEANSEDYKHM